MYLADYHIHSKYSIDGCEDIDTICAEAIKKGLNEICITDHYDPHLNDIYCEKTYSAFEIKQMVAQAQEKYKGRLKLIYGVEAGQAQIYPESVKALLNLDFDYVIGSVHNILIDEDLAFVNYTEKNKGKYFETYFSELLQMSRIGLYDCVGHMDYPKRYAAKAGLDFVYSDYIDIIKSIFKEVISQGRGIEINCSGLRGLICEPLPSFDLIKLYRELGGEIITMGSDAHHLKDVGEKIAEGYELLKNAGFNYITTYEKRKPHFIKL